MTNPLTYLTSRLWLILALLSLGIAFFIGHFAAIPDYHPLLQRAFPGSQFEELKGLKSRQTLFLRSHKSLKEPERLIIAQGQSFGGPAIMAISFEEAKRGVRLKELTLLSDKDTPSYIDKMEKRQFFTQFRGKYISDNLIAGEDVDVVSGATISSNGMANAARKALHEMAVSQFKYEQTWQAARWQFKLTDLALVLLIGAIVYSTYSHSKLAKLLRRVTPYCSLALVGFLINASLSIGSLSGLVMGYFPEPKQNPTWWIMMGTVLGFLLLAGRNIYCDKICPFHAVETLAQRISGMKLNLNPELMVHADRAIWFLLWLSLMLIFLSHHPALGSYEPFSMMFSLNGIGFQWYLLPLSVFGSLFVPNFWCRYFCPVGLTLNSAIRTRANLLYHAKGLLKGEAALGSAPKARAAKRPKKVKNVSVVASALTVLTFLAVLAYLGQSATKIYATGPWVKALEVLQNLT